MVKSRAEICRDYRRRLKEKYEERYLKKEREERRKCYVSPAQLSDSERKKRNIQNKINLRLHKQKKKLAEQEQHQFEESAAETSGYESVQPSSSNILQVALPFPNRRRGSQARRANKMSRMRK